VFEAVGGAACAKALTNPEKTNRAARAQLRENFRMGPQLYGLLRVVVVFCFKLLMGVPWHAFPPEALLVRRIIKGLLPQISEKHAASVNSVEGVSFERRLIRRQTVGHKVNHTLK
jgi:hypothetical protein